MNALLFIIAIYTTHFLVYSNTVTGADIFLSIIVLSLPTLIKKGKSNYLESCLCICSGILIIWNLQQFLNYHSFSNELFHIIMIGKACVGYCAIYNVEFFQKIRNVKISLIQLTFLILTLFISLKYNFALVNDEYFAMPNMKPFFDSIDVGFTFTLLLYATLFKSTKNEFSNIVITLTLSIVCVYAILLTGSRISLLVSTVLILIRYINLTNIYDSIIIVPFALVIFLVIDNGFISMKISNMISNISNRGLVESLLIDNSLNVRYYNYFTIFDIMRPIEYIFGFGRGQYEGILLLNSYNNSLDINILKIFIEFGIAGVAFIFIIYYKLVKHYKLLGIIFIIYCQVQNSVENSINLTTFLVFITLIYDPNYKLRKNYI